VGLLHPARRCVLYRLQASKQAGRQAGRQEQYVLPALEKARLSEEDVLGKFPDGVLAARSVGPAGRQVA
jgi:hypothetical protein